MYVSEVITIPMIMQIRLSKPETIKSRSDLGFNQINLILKKEQPVVIPQPKILKNERKWTDMYFSEHDFVVEIDKQGHIDRNQNKGNERQTKI